MKILKDIIKAACMCAAVYWYWKLLALFGEYVLGV